MNRLWLLPFVAVLALMSAVSLSVAATRTIRGTVLDDVMTAGEHVDVRGNVAGDTVVAGHTIDIAGRVGDTLIAAGRYLTIAAAIGNDAILAGQTVRTSGTIGDNLFAMGRSVEIMGRVGGKTFAAGGSVSLGPRARLEDDTRLAGRTLILAGTIARSARLNGGDVTMNGTVRGDARVKADHLRLGSTARIGGKLIIESASPPEVASGAVVAGGISHRLPEEATGGVMQAIASALIPALVMLAGLWIVGAIVLLLAPGFVRRVQRAFVSHPLRALGVGLVIAIASLPFAVLLGLTLIGLPFAFGLMGAYFFALGTAVPFFGLAVARTWATRRGGHEPPRRSAMLARLAVVLLIVVLLGAIPFVGGLVWAGSALLGMGAAGLALIEAWRGRDTGGPAPPGIAVAA